MRKDRERVLRRARDLVRTISDLEEKQSFEDVERVRKLCNDIQSICNEIDSMIVEKITTSELHDLHVQCLEARARVLRRIQSSTMMEAGLEAGLARLASAENSPQPESSQHVSKAVEWLRAAAKTLESKRQQSGEDQQYRDTQIRVLVSLGDAYVVFSSVGFNNITHSLTQFISECTLEHEENTQTQVRISCLERKKAGESVVQGGSRICHLMLSSSTSTRNTIRKVSTCTHGIGKSFRTSL